MIWTSSSSTSSRALSSPPSRTITPPSTRTRARGERDRDGFPTAFPRSTRRLVSFAPARVETFAVDDVDVTREPLRQRANVSNLRERVLRARVRTLAETRQRERRLARHGGARHSEHERIVRRGVHRRRARHQAQNVRLVRREKQRALLGRHTTRGALRRRASRVGVVVVVAGGVVRRDHLVVVLVDILPFLGTLIGTPIGTLIAILVDLFRGGCRGGDGGEVRFRGVRGGRFRVGGGGGGVELVAMGDRLGAARADTFGSRRGRRRPRPERRVAARPRPRRGGFAGVRGEVRRGGCPGEHRGVMRARRGASTGRAASRGSGCGSGMGGGGSSGARADDATVAVAAVAVVAAARRDARFSRRALTLRTADDARVPSSSGVRAWVGSTRAGGARRGGIASRGLPCPGRDARAPRASSSATPRAPLARERPGSWRADVLRDLRRWRS